jgi:AmiR/NasT family two-component response regulator
MRVLIIEKELLLAVLVAEDLRAAGHKVVGVATDLSQGKILAVEKPPELAIINTAFVQDRNFVDFIRTLRNALNCPSLLLGGSIREARKAGDNVLGVVITPHDMTRLSDSLDVISSIFRGRELTYMPPGLVLFRQEARL